MNGGVAPPVNVGEPRRPPSHRCGAPNNALMYDELCGMIRKRDKRIGGFGHEQVLQNNGAWPGYGIGAATGPDGRGESIGA
jgi:hypothetical protein